MDSPSPFNGWPHHRIPKRSHGGMERGHRDSSEQAAFRHPTPFRQSTNSTPPASSTAPLHHHHHPNHPQTSGLHLPPLHHRFAGDGFDFRRPAMATSTAPTNGPPADVIDLTSEDEPSQTSTPIAPPMQSTRASRPPRFAREIIDLSDDTPPHPPANPAQNQSPSSPEVEFVSSRTIPSRRPHAPAVDLTDDDFDFDVLVAADFGYRHGINRAPPGDGGYRTRSRRNSPLRRRLVHILDGLFELHAPPLANFLGPGPMNYGAVGFDLGYERESTPATYEAPSMAPPGFTRSPEEEDVLVCPNCDSELCVGPEGGEKRQVWIIKACGHAYCGECANNRHASKRKGKEPAGTTTRLPNPFQRCVVKDCGKKCTARTAMIQLFL